MLKLTVGAHTTGPGRHRPPRPPLAPGERVLVADPDGCGGVVVATTWAIYHRPDPQSAWRQLCWEEIGRVDWDARNGRLALTGIRPGFRLSVSVRPDVARLVRERVAATLLASGRVRVNDHASALVLARRRPGADEPVWVVVLDGDADEPAVTAAVRAFRSYLGL